MTDSSLQDRLREHAKAFDGLLSLIPAKMYYGEDTSDQWNRKKQTKAEAKAARKGKLDPDSELNRNAKEVMEERAKNKRKLQEMEEAERQDAGGDGQDNQDNNQDNQDNDIAGVVQETPGEGLRRKDQVPNKKQRVAKAGDHEDHQILAGIADDNPAEMTQDQLMRAAKRDAKKAERKVKQAKKAEKRATKMAAMEATAATEKPAQKTSTGDKPSAEAQPKNQSGKGKAKNAEKTETVAHVDDQDEEEYETVSEDDNEEVETKKVPNKKTKPPPADAEMVAADDSKPTADSTRSSSRSASQSPIFDVEQPTSAQDTTTSSAQEPASTTTSINSTVPPSEKPKQLKIPQDTSALKARLAARIAELQAARKAIGPDGKPIRTRQELIEAQRARTAQRKEHKKELRRQAKVEEERQRDEALASNSPSVMSPALDHLLAEDAEGGGAEPTDYSFGRVAFSDNTRLSRDLTHVLHNAKKKGPSDPKTALLKLQNQKKRHAVLDEAKQKDLEEKDAWLTARRRAEGEKIHDDEAMLKKTIKRKDKQKKKSEREWKERSEGVQRAVREKQKKRDDNLKKRRDDKKLGRAGRKAVVAATGKKKGGSGGGRPGFEGGSFGMGGKKKK